MHRTKLMLLTVIVCGLAGSVAYRLTSASAGPPASTRLVRVAWAPVSLGDGGRLLTIRYRAAPCAVAAGRIALTESSRTIAIRVVQRVASSPDVSCAAVASFPTLCARLHAPLDGRALAGGVGVLGPVPAYRAVAVPDPPHSPVRLPLVPGVVGFRLHDARDVLRGDGLRARVEGGHGEVAVQRPRPGHLAPGTTRAHPFGGVVKLTARR
jgi:hypothetical protein